jgi:hypothetical protein
VDSKALIEEETARFAELDNTQAEADAAKRKSRSIEERAADTANAAPFSDNDDIDDEDAVRYAIQITVFI